MDMVPLNNGVNMPMLGLGTYALRGGDCERCVLEALELGYRLFDTAQMYGNEGERAQARGRTARRAVRHHETVSAQRILCESETGH